MEELLIEHGYPALLLLSLLASTLVPLGSEWLLVVLLLKGFDPVVTVTLATLGNTLGALTTYGVGLWGGPFLVGRVLRIDAAARRRAEGVFSRYGRWALLFSWLPVVGDPLCLIGGVLRLPLFQFVLLVALGKVLRYGVVAWLALTGSAAV